MPPSGRSVVCMAPQSGSCCAGVFLQRSDGSAHVPDSTQLGWTVLPATHESTFVALCCWVTFINGSGGGMFLFETGTLQPFPGSPHCTSLYWERPAHVLWPLLRRRSLRQPLISLHPRAGALVSPFLLDNVRSYIVHGNKTLGVF